MWYKKNGAKKQIFKTHKNHLLMKNQVTNNVVYNGVITQQSKCIVI